MPRVFLRNETLIITTGIHSRYERLVLQLTNSEYDSVTCELRKAGGTITERGTCQVSERQFRHLARLALQVLDEH